MPTPKSPRAKAQVTTPTTSVNHQARAPFGFIFFFLLLVATFAFSTFFVISQTAREQTIRREAAANALVLEQRVNALQTQVNTLSEQVALQQTALESLRAGTSSTRPAQR